MLKYQFGMILGNVMSIQSLTARTKPSGFHTKRRSTRSNVFCRNKTRLWTTQSWSRNLVSVSDLRTGLPEVTQPEISGRLIFQPQRKVINQLFNLLFMVCLTIIDIKFGRPVMANLLPAGIFYTLYNFDLQC